MPSPISLQLRPCTAAPTLTGCEPSQGETDDELVEDVNQFDHLAEDDESEAEDSGEDMVDYDEGMDSDEGGDAKEARGVAVVPARSGAAPVRSKVSSAPRLGSDGDTSGGGR